MYFKKAINIDSNMVEPHHSLANALLHQNKVEEALEYSKRVVQLNPKHKQGYVTLGTEYSMLGNVE